MNIQDAAGWTPLHEACNYGQVKIAEILIEAGAHIDDRGGPKCDGITPLLDAACNGHLEMINLLLNKGASPFARSNQVISKVHNEAPSKAAFRGRREKLVNSYDKK